MTRNFTKCAFLVTLNIEVERQGVEKAVFFADCMMFMDFKMKSSRKYCTIASKCRSPFSRKGLWEVVTIKIKTYKTKSNHASTDQFAAGSCALAIFTCFRYGTWRVRMVCALYRGNEQNIAGTRVSHRHCTWCRKPGGDPRKLVHCSTIKKLTLLTKIHGNIIFFLSKYKIWYSSLLLLNSVV